MTIQRVTQLPEPPPRPDDAHKGTFGRVLVVAGSRGMSGAACLTALGALRGGAGLVYVAAPGGIIPIVAGIEPSYLTIPLSEDASGRIAVSAGQQLVQAVPGNDVLAFGPGWGRSHGLTELAHRLYTTVEIPAVVDADGLNALSEAPEALSQAPAGRILTPHPGEFARLIGGDIKTVQQDREELAARFAGQKELVLVLKGRGTVVTDGKQLAVNETGNSGMATGGTGDVLTGLIAALLAQGMSPFDAAHLGVYVHGLAGDLAAEDLSGRGLIASDVARYLAAAWKQIDRAAR